MSKPEFSSLTGLAKTLRKVLWDRKVDYAIRLVSDDKYAEEVKNKSWDLIPVITEHLTDENKQKNPEFFKSCANLVYIISTKSNTEEVLLQLVSEIEEARENSKFTALLEPLYQVVCRTSNKKPTSFAWCFNSIQTYLNHCSLPDYETFEGKERLLVDQCEPVSNIVGLYTEVLVFYNKCLKFLQSENDSVQLVLRKFLIQLLGGPLFYLNVETFGSVNTEGLILSQDIVRKVLPMIGNPILLTESRYEKNVDDFTTPNTSSIANFFYLIYTEGICYQSVPKVYNSEFMLNSCLYLINYMLETNSNILIEKAIKFAKTLLQSLSVEQLSFWNLDSEDHSKFCKLLSNVIIYNQSENVRKTALLVLSRYIKCFDIKGFYLIISNLLQFLSHSGLKGFLVTLYKDALSRHMNINEENLPPYFKGTKFFSIMLKCCHLEEQEKTDIVKNSDQIISALNMIRYVALRDGKNCTQVRQYVPALQSSFLDPLRRALELSVAHYELEIKNINEEQTSKENRDVTVSVCGTQLPQMKKEEKLRVLQSSLTVFDVINSLLVRVTEVIENKI